MLIEDGKGRGNSVAVSSENKLAVEAVSSSIEHHVNHHNGDAYNLVFSQSPTAAGDCIFYMVNEAESDLVIEGFTLSVVDCTANDSLYCQISDTGTRNGATDITPVNLNSGSGKSAEGTFEKGADLDGGAATLAGGSEFERIVFSGITDVSALQFNFTQDVIVPKNRTFTMWVGGSATGTYYVTLHFNYHDIEE